MINDEEKLTAEKDMEEKTMENDEKMVNEAETLTNLSQEQLQKAKAEATKIIEQAMLDAEKILIEAKSTKEKAETSKRNYDELLKKIDEDRKSIIDDANQKAVQIENNALKRANDIKLTSESEARKAYDEMISNAQKIIDKNLKELDQLRKKEGEELNKKKEELNEKEIRLGTELDKCYKEQRDALEQELSAKKKENERLLSAEYNSLLKRNTTLKQENEQLAGFKNELDEAKVNLELEQKKLDKEKEDNERIKSNILDFAEGLVKERYKELIAEKENYRQKLNEQSRLHQELHAQLLDKTNKLNQLKNKDFIENLENEKKSLQAENTKLKNEKKELEKQEINGTNMAHFLELKNKEGQYTAALSQLQDLIDENARLKSESRDVIALQEQVDRANKRYEDVKKELNDVQTELNKRNNPDQATRIKPVVESRIDSSLVEIGDAVQSFRDKCNSDRKEPTELVWLDYVKKGMETSGISFSERLLKAYHTSMKIENASPLTVLAGVSGTGKSELPRQYALHGGIGFLPIAVKPDWDSPSSLFGFYNSIESKYQPTELLNAIYHLTHNSKLSNRMMIVLLDEMNLAHIELYFADLLSKFETARGSGTSLNYQIDLGAGAAPFDISIPNRILWTGTMNEDETTKALSDKVIDRSTLITFPRPESLISRSSDCMNDPADFYLSSDTWKSWCSSSYIPSEEGLNKISNNKLIRFKEIVEKTNKVMSNMGRNLGHRVWQSIAKYVAAHPDVCDAYHKSNDKLDEVMDHAFTEAYAFKVMPKLRGLETSGSYERYLDEIAKIIADSLSSLEADYKHARSLPSGIFQWSSAKFMDN